jgi:PAS domain S-box-containing protein
MKLLTNPIFLRMAAVFFAAMFAFIVGLIAMRRLRKGLIDEDFSLDTPRESESLPLHTYHAVIQQLKQQKHELQSMRQSERRRAKTSESISAAVLSNLSCGVMFFTANGLVRQANASAKSILGFASLVGMSAAELFRDANLLGSSQTKLAEAIQAALQEKSPYHRLEAEYVTPRGEERELDITVSSLHGPDSEALGAACLINDRTEFAEIRRQHERRGEMSAEMALELRTSLTTISGYAQQLAASRDPELARQLAADIAAEAAGLDRRIGGFLAGTAARAAAQV